MFNEEIYTISIYLFFTSLCPPTIKHTPLNGLSYVMNKIKEQHSEHFISPVILSDRGLRHDRHDFELNI